MKKHPGIYFTIWSIITTFLLSFEAVIVNIPQWITGSIIFFWWAMCGYWITVFHIRWLIKLDKKYYKE